MSNALVVFTRVVGWIDVVDAARASELNLEDRLLASSPGIVGMLGRIYPQRTWLQQLAVLLKLFTMAAPDSTAYDRDNL